MNKIIPSTKLKMVSVHKLYALSCMRKYFWRWVCNLDPRKPNFNFWYGGVLHIGFEMLLLKGLAAALREMKKESKRRLARYVLSDDDKQEIGLQFRIITAIIREAAKQSFIKDMELDETEIQLKCKIPGTDIIFCTTPDGFGRYKGKSCSYEIKTASRVNNNFFTALSFDHQIHAGAWAVKQNKKKPITRCTYCVFRKSAKRVKKHQTSDEFVKEIEQDLKKQPKWYFIIHEQPLGRNTVIQAGKTIESSAQLLQKIYDVPEEKLLDPLCWPCNNQNCLSFGACPYLILCRNLAKWRLYTRFYQQREMLYDEEKEELKY